MALIHSLTTERTAPVARIGAVLQALTAAALGVVLLAGVGFWQVEAVHNAAHDTRHSAGFPCH
jgi:cobalt transporter subunit CbtB